MESEPRGIPWRRASFTAEFRRRNWFDDLVRQNVGRKNRGIADQERAFPDGWNPLDERFEGFLEWPRHDVLLQR